jgi:hypothetical protein
MTDINRPQNFVHNHEERTSSHQHPVVFRRVSTVLIAERWPTLNRSTWTLTNTLSPRRWRIGDRSTIRHRAAFCDRLTA